MKNLDLQNKRVLAKALSEIENSDRCMPPSWYEEVYKLNSRSSIIGITGAPGAGKSSLINHLISEFRSANKTVAVLAVDPSSPFSGGAILGDRTRMIISAEDKGVFVRSVASRGKLGGLSPRTFEMIHVLKAAGFDVIIIETVGVGQAEMDIMRCADLVSLVLSPHTGDSLQALKAGILEIADLYVLNKSDLIGINDLEKDLLSSLSLSEDTRPILKTSSLNNSGIKILHEKIIELSKNLDSTGELQKRRKESLIFQFNLNLRELLIKRIEEDPSLKTKKEALEASLLKGQISPLKAADSLNNSLLST